METRTLKPAVPGSVVRMPVTAYALPEDGAEVEMNTYWHRRLRDGDVVEVPPAPAKAARRSAE